MDREGLPRSWPTFVGLALIVVIVAGGMGLLMLREQQGTTVATVAPPRPVPEASSNGPLVDGQSGGPPGTGAQQEPIARSGGEAVVGEDGGGQDQPDVAVSRDVPERVLDGVPGRAVAGMAAGALPGLLAGGGVGLTPETAEVAGIGLQDVVPYGPSRPSPGAPGGSLPGAPARPDGPHETVGSAPSPRIALIIDDWGYDWEAADAFFVFPEPLTIAVLPHLPRSAEQALRAQAAGFEVIVHMPMEPQDSSLDIGPGGIYASMADEEIAAAVRAALAAVPGARGLNNHMGSKATTDPRVMRAALQVLAEQGLFFVDSYTVASTVGYRVAHELQVPYAVNQVFLDHVDDEEAIRRQIRRLMNLALERGAAVGIGHVRPRTYAALVDMLPEIRAAGIRLVPVSQLLTGPARERMTGADGPMAPVRPTPQPVLDDAGTGVNGARPVPQGSGTRLDEPRGTAQGDEQETEEENEQESEQESEQEKKQESEEGNGQESERATEQENERGTGQGNPRG